MPTRINAQLLEAGASSVGVRITLPACEMSAANDRKDKRANAGECEQQTNTHRGSQEEEFLDVYLYQLQEGKSQNPTVAIHVNGIPISLHLDTQV